MTRRASTRQTVLGALVALGTLISQTVDQPAVCGSEIKTADVNGATLHYRECGEGEPLVFVHGGFGDLHTFNAQFEEFAEAFRVIAYSRRFHPPNDPPQAGDTYSMQLHVDDLAALMRELKAGPAHIVAHSYGGTVALAFALEHPELVRSLVLGEPPVPSLLERTAVGKALGESFNTRVIGASRTAFESGDSEEGVRRFLDGISAVPWFDRLPQSEREKYMEKAPEFRLEMLTEKAAYLPSLPCETVRQLERPVLSVTGERSTAFSLLTSAELERCLEGESHVMVPEVGHGVMENPAFYNEAVLAFLRRH
jgi:non-heme chloroperoxidase